MPRFYFGNRILPLSNRTLRYLFYIVLSISFAFLTFNMTVNFAGLVYPLHGTINIFPYLRQTEDPIIDILTRRLKIRLSSVNEPSEKFDFHLTCTTNASIGNSCTANSCFRLKPTRTPRERIEQIMKPGYLRLTQQSKIILKTMAENVNDSYNITVVSALSSNHFIEAQGMLYNIHNNLFPHIRNFTLIIYNLGLSSTEWSFIAKICKCHMIDFPFHKFPKYVSTLHCYTWKALIINAHIAKTNILIWMDTSVRFLHDPRTIADIFTEVTVRGIQMGAGIRLIPHQTLPSMFHYFLDEPCMYLLFREAMSGMIVLRNDLLVRLAVLEPWAACALNDTCMCPTDRTDLDRIVKATACRSRKGPYHYGACHRFDQSAISILIAKLYQEHYSHIVRNYSKFWQINRNDRIKYPASN